tara:strand:- start:31 stop:921 length:891 start_codon:yes stop_codon:yes gene_type:complete
MNNLNETKKTEKKKNKIFLIKESSSKNLKDVKNISKWMGKNFSISERQYFAGMMDGDGYVGVRIPKDRKHLKLSVVLELRHDHAEPIYRLAELFDLSIAKRIYLKRKNTKPSLKVELSGVKARLFLICIYPYMLEKKKRTREILLKLDCPERHLSETREFSLEYLAGYIDAEGSVHFKLSHQKTKVGNITSAYRYYLTLTSNDKDHLQYVKQNLIKLGYDHFRKNYVNTHKAEKKSPRLGTNPDKWNDTTHIILGGSHKQLSKLYKNVEPFMLIKHKKDNMKSTIRYNNLFNKIKN